jgi:hemolysin activation/secretion protein
MLKRRIIITFLLVILNANFAQAQLNQDVINGQDWISRQQQNKLEEDRRLKDLENIDKERSRKKSQAEKEKKQTAISDGLEKCFPIKSVKLTGVESISFSAQNKIITPFIGECVSAKILAELVAKIQNHYNELGYVTATVSVPQQNIQSGDIELKISEGKIDEVILGDNKFSEKMQEFTAFGFIEGEVLNIKDIDQGIYQINRLPSNNAIVKIEPAANEGESKIYVTNEKRFPARATIGYDNLGNEFTGIRRSNFSGSFDNLLSLNDALNVSYSTNLDDDSQKKDIKSFSFGASIPFGYNTFSYDYSRSEFRGINALSSSASKFTGYSNRNNFSIDRALFSEGNLRISGNASITAKESASYLDDAKLENSERKLTIGNAGFSISNYFKNGLNLYLKPSYSRGLKLLNAKQDAQSPTSDTARAQFQLIKLYASLSKKFLIPKLEMPILLSSEMDSQISKNTLFGSEQFSVGGYYSVRGFRENYITGDSGYYFRNKANFGLSSLLKTEQAYLNKIAFEPFYDYGYVKTRYNGDSGRLSGAGIKTIFDGKYFSASLTYSWALNKSKLITATQKENKMLYFEISASCC